MQVDLDRLDPPELGVEQQTHLRRARSTRCTEDTIPCHPAYFPATTRTFEQTGYGGTIDIAISAACRLKCVPAPSRIIPSVRSGDHPARYGRSDVIASYTSAIAHSDPKSWIISGRFSPSVFVPLSPRG